MQSADGQVAGRIGSHRDWRTAVEPPLPSNVGRSDRRDGDTITDHISQLMSSYVDQGRLAEETSKGNEGLSLGGTPPAAGV